MICALISTAKTLSVSHRFTVIQINNNLEIKTSNYFFSNLPPTQINRQQRSGRGVSHFIWRRLYKTQSDSFHQFADTRSTVCTSTAQSDDCKQHLNRKTEFFSYFSPDFPGFSHRFTPKTARTNTDLFIFRASVLFCGFGVVVNTAMVTTTDCLF